MRDSSTLSLGLQPFALWAVLVTTLGLCSCFRTLDLSKVPCSDEVPCPTGYSCARTAGAAQGHCALGSTDAAGGDQRVSTVPDGKVGSDVGPSVDGAGGARDGMREIGAGGTGGHVDAPLGGTGGTTTTTGTREDAAVEPDVPLPPIDAVFANGSPCTVDGECASTFCVDGVCCDGRCDGNCESCSTGACAFSAKPRKDCAGTGKCVGFCEKSNRKECTFPDDKTVCAAQSCAAGVRTDKALCDGKGGCPPQSKTNCTGALCLADGSDCANCTDDSSAVTCAGGHCGPTVNNCGRTVQCPIGCSGVHQTCGGGGTSGLCGCTSASKAETCGTAKCGTVTDNCGKEISCGTCTDTGSTCVDGTCCTRACTGKCSGPDGCGGTCSSPCPSGQTCGAVTANVCGCAPNCTGKCSGPDGCGGTCSGPCPPGQTCGAVTANVCGCAPNCTGKCGGAGDGCGGTCTAECGSNAVCQNGACQPCGTLTACSGTCVNTSTSSANCGQCGRACNPGQTCCSGGCVDLNSSGANCGTCGRSCGSQTCMVGICCDSTSVNCGGSCCDSNHSCTGSTCSCPGYSLSCGGCPVWNFETNSTEGWLKTPAGLREETSGNAIQSIGVSTSRFEQGSHSLAVRIITNSSNRYATLSVPLCPSGAAVTLPAGITFSASFFFASDSGSYMPSFVSAMVELLGPNDPERSNDPDLGTAFPGGSWFTYRAAFPNGATATHVNFFWLPGEAWSGTMYMDRVKLSM